LIGKDVFLKGKKLVGGPQMIQLSLDGNIICAIKIIKAKINFNLN
jgi:hypothetical protein